MNLAGYLKEIYHTFGNYLDIGEAPDGFFVFLRHVGPDVYGKVQERILKLGGVEVSSGTLGDSKRATWKIQRPPAENVVERKFEFVRLEPEAEL